MVLVLRIDGDAYDDDDDGGLGVESGMMINVVIRQ